MHYASPKHERLYRNITRGKHYPASTLAALFLLTANRKLWLRWRLAISNHGIDWTACKNIDPDWDGTALEQAALSLDRRTALQVPLYKLADPVEYPQELLKLVITALWIARNRSQTTQEILINRKGKHILC